MIIRFEVPGDPVAKARARASIQAGCIRMHTPVKTERYESRVAIFAKQAMEGRAPLEGGLVLSVCAWFSIPESWSKKRKAAALNGTEHHTKRPDLDNVIKAIKDGMNGIVWKDDSQVCRLDECMKRYGEQPCVAVTVRLA